MSVPTPFLSVTPQREPHEDPCHFPGLEESEGEMGNLQPQLPQGLKEEGVIFLLLRQRVSLWHLSVHSCVSQLL